MARKNTKHSGDLRPIAQRHIPGTEPAKGEMILQSPSGRLFHLTFNWHGDDKTFGTEHFRQ